MWTRAACTFAALAAAAAGAFAFAMPRSAPTKAPAEAVVAPAMTSMLPAPKAMKFPTCLNAFSKDQCDAIMYPGTLYGDSCSGSNGDCKTYFIADATLYSPMRANQRQCGPDGKCDETKDGYLKLAVNYTVRINKPCPFRGCIDGRGEFRFDDGTTYCGTFQGTIGVGTHRKSECLEYRNCYCEECLDVEFLPEIRTWRIGWEGAFHGERCDIPSDGEMLCFTVSGDWYLEGDENGPYDWNGNFKIKGTADGVLGTYCQ